MNSVVKFAARVPALSMMVASLALTAFTGCDNNGGLSNVTGVVTYNGAPYPNAQVRFVPEGGRPSIGLTDANGAYKLHYLREQFGALPGSYKVDITTVYTSDSDTAGGKTPPEKLPAKYNVKTELVKEVTPGDNKIDFELLGK